MRKLLSAILLLLSLSSYSQDKSKFIYVNVLDKSVSLTPFYKVFGSSFDPAITLGGGIEYLQKGKSTIFQVVQLNGFSTKMIGAGFTATTSIGYRFSLHSGLFAELMLGFGGSGFLPSRETFVLDDADQYVSENTFQAIIGVPIDMAAGYRTGAYSFYLKYRYMIEGTYTDILPMLPTSLIGIGASYTLSNKSE